MVLAGLAGSPQMISATLLALTRIMYEFKGNDLEVFERKGFIYESCCEKPDLIKYEQQRCRSACLSRKFDQHLQVYNNNSIISLGYMPQMSSL